LKLYIDAGFCRKVLDEFYMLKQLKSRDTITRSLYPRNFSKFSSILLCYNFYLISCILLFGDLYLYIWIFSGPVYQPWKFTSYYLWHKTVAGHHDEASSLAHYCLRSLGFAYRIEWCCSHCKMHLIDSYILFSLLGNDHIHMKNFYMVAQFSLIFLASDFLNAIVISEISNRLPQNRLKRRHLCWN
jgi:hypothetical protein